MLQFQIELYCLEKYCFLLNSFKKMFIHTYLLMLSTFSEKGGCLFFVCYASFLSVGACAFNNLL